jgi:hypothetical protein
MDLMTKYRNIYNEVSKDHLQEEINSAANNVVADIIKIGRWKSSNESIRLEDEAEAIQRKVMNGQCQVIDYQEAVRKWKSAGIKG